ncbi:AGE family epimerase/isomerase [uncultured Pseudokineococcus sp.]|uniref:AGE family epimerase/isomerase n=1 Tax=uncultured Pseudokineococcus sp. TaxID=1642928 RepID=UPI002612633D|nr:AGE family epimerase/isomerase [uncultured Pseudokineococcus sp.]
MSGRTDGRAGGGGEPRVGGADLRAHAAALVDFSRASAVPGGSAWLDDDGRPTDRDVQLWITCRMTHCAALGELLGDPSCAALVEHGLDALLGPLRDDEHGGWYAAVSRTSLAATSDRKDGYGHAFVVLAASSAAAAGHERAGLLLEEALAVSERHFWEEGEGLVREAWDRSFGTCEDYRGVNGAMHTVEAYLAASDVTGDGAWRRRAARIARRVVHGWARANDWRVPEHFTARWEPLLEHNVGAPADPFRPYGATVGHALEWARLVLQVDAALRAAGEGGLPWAVEAATALAQRAVADGWEVDGAPGFVYTTDWQGAPVVRHRMHWVVAEALGAGVALERATGDPVWRRWTDRWWAYVDDVVVDHERGSWRHELDAANRPSSATWSGKPDVYHALQACLVGDLPLHPSFATALRQRREIDR